MKIIRKSITTLFFLAVLLIPLLLPASLPVANAQESTEEADVPVVETVTATEAPSETPLPEETPIVTEASPTEEDTSTPEPELTEDVTEAAPEETASVEVTEEASEEVTPLPEEILIFSDDFSTFNTDKWILNGWSVTDGTLRTNQTASSATVLNFEPVDFELNAQVLIPENNVMVIAFRSGVSSYRAMLSSNGSVRLYQDAEILDTYASNAESGTWMNINFLVAGDTIALSINDISGIVYTDEIALTDGQISFLTDGEVTAEIMVDNLTITSIDASTVIFPDEVTSEAEVTAEAETTPEAEVTAEAETTPEAEITAEAETTPEAEATVEAETTPEAEATVEAETTPEAEATVEAETTPEAEALNTLAYEKSPVSLHEVLDILSDEDGEYPDPEAVAQILLDFDGYVLDINDNVALEISPADNVILEEIERLVAQVGGRISVTSTQTVTAFIPLGKIFELLESPLVASVEQPDVARSTGPAPSDNEAPTTATYTEGFDMLGVTDWHNAGFTGTGVRVGIIDSGYNTFTAGDPEYACLAGPVNVVVPNDHGLAMIELICDIAPNADVYTYEVSTSAYAGLTDAVFQAISDNIDVLVISLDMMEVTPGDGTGMGDGDDPYIALNTARNQGMIIFAAAGNGGASYSTATGNRIERFVTLNVPAPDGGFDPDNSGTHELIATIEIKATAGDEIVVTWDDWFDRDDGAMNLSDDANIEDFDIEVRLDPAGRYDEFLVSDYEANDYYVDAFGEEENGRDSRFDDPSISYQLRTTVDLNGTNAGIIREGCPVLNATTTHFDSECSVIVTITRVRGDAPVTMQVAVIPGDKKGNNPTDGSATLAENPTEDIRISSVTLEDLPGVDAIIENHKGTLARPADSPDVIAVGAVCANDSGNLGLIPSSAQGPIFDTFGDPNSASAPTNFGDTKPDILSTSFVSTSFSSANTSACDGTVGGIANTGGFGGTSAAAGHAAAMTAVLLSNPTYSTMLNTGGVQAIEDYIMNHAVELPLGNTADGLDYIHGTGFFILGSPQYNPVNTINPAIAPDLIIDSGRTAGCQADGIFYVGQGNPSATQDGSFTNPFSSIGTAIGLADGSQCIIVMPGEYMTPILLDESDVRIFGYSSLSTIPLPATIINVSGQYSSGTVVANGISFDNNAGFYINAVSNARIDSMTFIHSNTLDGLPRQAVGFNNAINSILANSQIGGLTVDGVTYSGWDNGDETPVLINDGTGNSIEDNLFYNNTGGIPATNRLTTGVISILNADGGSPILISGNRIENNTAITKLTSDYWSTLIYSADSNTNIVGNFFIGNTASTIITGQTELTGDTEELNIVSNVFLNNTSNITINDGATVNAGAIVQTYYTPELTFANNTVVHNNLAQSGSNAAILGRGTPGGAQVASDYKLFDFVNNLVYDNTWSGTATGVLSTTDGSSVTQCNSLDGSVDQAIQGNWWFDYTNNSVFNINNVSCFGAMVGATNNIFGNDPSTNQEFVGMIPGSTLNALTDPEYYALAQSTTPSEYSQGIDHSDVSLLSGGVDLSATPFNVDANREARNNDITNWAKNNTTDIAGFTVDTGAYEFSALTLPIGDDYNYTNYPGELIFDEDTGIIVIDLASRVSGGLGDEIFTLTSQPDNYGTQCGAEYTDSNQGMFFGTGANASRVFYCPPTDFYTGHSTAGIPVTDLTFSYEVTDASNQTQSEAVTFVINPVNDALLNVVSGGLQYSYIGNLGQTGISLRMRPFVDYSNFRFSERGNADFYVGGLTAIDYPFSYGSLTVSGDLIFAVAPVISGDFIDFDLNEIGGIGIIEYTATDIRGGTVTVSISVNNVSRLPSEPGIYDDSSFAFDYSDGWTAGSDTNAINNTMHTSNSIGATASFGIRGTGFSLYMDGRSSLGGDWTLEIAIDSASTYTAVSNWTQVPDSVVYQGTVSDADTVFFCSTTGINTLAVPISLSSRPLTDTIVRCDGYSYTDSIDNDVYDDGEVLADLVTPGVHLVNIVNTGGRYVGVDAFALLDATVATGSDLPLGPGIHDVEDLVLRDAFGLAWGEATLTTYSNRLAYQLLGEVLAPDASNTVSFYITGGTGFAIETTLSRVNPEYTICVSDVADNSMTCQEYDYSSIALLSPVFSNVYRPFYGLDPAATYRVDILPTSVPATSKFIIDSVVVYEPTDTTSELAAGVVADTDIDALLYGGFKNNSWALNARAIGASDGTMTSVNVRNRQPGPYVAFDVDSAVDTVYWTFDTRRASRQAMVCVDRAQGVGTNADTSTPPTYPAEVNAAHGNCLVINLTDGSYLYIDNSGTGILAPGNIRLVSNTIILDEKVFDSAWNNANGKHTFEIFSLYDATLSVDSITAIGSAVPLLPGRYEEYISNIGYFDAGLADAPPTPTESRIVSTYTGTFTQVLGRTVRDFGGGVVYSNEVGATIGFQFTGTGFAPAFRMSAFSEEVLICWEIAGGVLDAAEVANALTGDCMTFDNENRVPTYNALRPILGLPDATYTVAIRFQGDNFSPKANRSLSPDMWFDGIVIYDDDLTTLTPMINGVTYDGNFAASAGTNTFAYFGDKWATLAGARARLYLNSNVDNIIRGEAGATVAFRVTSANVIRLTQPLGVANSPFLVCADDGTNRHCQTIDVYGRGNNAEFSIYLSEDASVADYTVTITALTGGRVYFDAVTPMAITTALTAGKYDQDDPHIMYDYGSHSLLLNGSFERNIVDYAWIANSATIDNYVIRYSGTKGLRIIGAATPGVTSPTVSLRSGVTYSILAYVQVDRLSPATTVTMNVNNLTNAEVLPTATTDVARVGTFEPFRFTYTPASDIDVNISFTGSAGMTFYLDDVQIIEGGQWRAIGNPRVYEGYTTTSTVPGSQFSFSFTGTGFALGMPVSSSAGQVQVCYDSVATFATATCIVYDNEILRANTGNMRLVEGLTSGTYYVRVRDVEDGNSSSISTRYPSTRSYIRATGAISLDYVMIFDTTVETITDSGIYDNASASTGGSQYLALVPAENWSTITGRLAIRYSNGSYATPVTSTGAANRFASGPTAMFGLVIAGNDQARILIDMKAASRLASDQLLACIGGPDGEIARVDYDPLLRNLNQFELLNSTNCVLLDTLRTSRFITLTPDNLPALNNTTGVTVTPVLTIQTLTGGSFTIDGFQVLYGTQLTPGYYEESIGFDLLDDASLQPPMPDSLDLWELHTYPRYSGGNALRLYNPTSVTPLTDTLAFQFQGTGVSVVTADIPRAGELEITVSDQADGLGAINETINQDLNNTAAAYGTSMTVAGLPQGTYYVTVTATAERYESVAIDAIQIYGVLPSLGSLYDDNQVDTSGNALINYGPNNNSWVLAEGRFAVTALNQTLHATTSRGSIASFEIGETLPSDGIVIFYDARLTTAPSVRVCFRIDNPNLVGPDPIETAGELAGACVDQLLDESGEVTVMPTTPSVNQNYFVAIEQTDRRFKFALDAIQVLEDGLYEGIYNATVLHSDDGGDTSTLNTTVDAVELTNGQTLTFNMVGIAFSLEVAPYLGTTYDYDICVTDPNDADVTLCDVVNESSTVPLGISALTYAGLHGDGGEERTLEVTLTNNGNTTLRVNEVHVLGDDDTLLVNDTARYENDAVQIRYLPFGSYTEIAYPRSQQSGGNEHTSRIIGASVYFEISTATPIDAGFEIARRLSIAHGSAEVCYGQIDDTIDATITTESITDARGNAQCTTIEHNPGNAYQATDAITTGTNCANGCWVLVRNLEIKASPFDFVRLYDAGVAMQAGRFEENYPGLNFEDDAGGTWNDINSPVANIRASGGFIRTATSTGSTSTENGPVMWFMMEGTGFAVNFLVDLNADAVEICYAPGTQADIAGVTTNVLDNGICQTYSNESRATVADAARTIVGLPQDTYTVAVRMLPDDGMPRAHSSLRPIKMQIDTVDVFDTDILATTLTPLANDTRHETSYTGRDTNNNFAYYGDSWISYSGARARRNSGLNYDQAREYGAGILFHAQGADGMTLYTNLSRVYSPIRVCVVPVNPTADTLGDTSLANCMDKSLSGTGFSQALSFRFRDFLETPASDYMVSIVSLTNGYFPIDAIELTSTGMLTEGFYEASNVSLYYDSQSTDHIVNGGMETDSDWGIVGSPTVVHQTVRYSGIRAYSVTGNRDTGIESAQFDLTGATLDAPIYYTAIARVRVGTGRVRMELVENGSPLSITEFRTLAPTAEADPLVWQTLRVNFTLTEPKQNLSLQLIAKNNNTLFYVDDVHLYQGGTWTTSNIRSFTEGHAAVGKTPGSSMQFTFEGTGFEIGTHFNNRSGEVEICYDSDDAIFGESGDLTEHCFTYQNEGRRPIYGASRTITGLPFGIYNVRVRDVEDGYSILGRFLGTARNFRFANGDLTIDWVNIFNDTTTPSITAGFFNEDAVDDTGENYLRLYPETSWTSVEGRFARGFSNESYVTPIDNRVGRANRYAAGPTASLSLDVTDDGATVIIYTGTIPNFNSPLVLICAGDEMSGEIVQVETFVGIRRVLEYALESPQTPGDCVVKNGKSGNAITVGPDDLAALGVAGTDVPISFTPLEPGQFHIDGFQVISGTVLTPGVYDDFLPDNILNFTSEASDAPSDVTTALCDVDNYWCPRKLRTAYGGQQLATQDPGATLDFDIYGTGFSVLTETSVYGAQMRICYTQTPVTGATNFPTRSETMSGGSYSWDNSSQDLTLGGVWCDLHTTSTVATQWNTFNEDRLNPLRGTQYGFAYYGLPVGNYSVQVMMFEEVSILSRNVITIDAIAVFDDYTSLPVMGTANSAAPIDNSITLLGNGFFDDAEAAISFEPSIAWSTATIARFGPPLGPFNITEHKTSNAGSIAQMRVTGNAVTLFQTLYLRNTADARICVRVTDAVIHCADEASTTAAEVENPTSTAPWALAVETANFSQQSRIRTFFAPIMFYGLGASTADLPHTIIIENRQHGRAFTIDAIQVHD